MKINQENVHDVEFDVDGFVWVEYTDTDTDTPTEYGVEPVRIARLTPSEYRTLIKTWNVEL